PEGHWLEAWTDDRPRPGVEVMAQPVVGRLFDTRPRLSSLLAWSGAQADDHAFVQRRWQRDGIATSEAAWDGAVRDGVVTHDREPPPQPIAPRRIDPPAAPAEPRAGAAPASAELVLYASVGLGDGTGATSNNGWL